MSHRNSFCLAILAIIVGASALTGCFTTPATRDVGADIEVTTREGMGGTGISPNVVAEREGMGGSGIDPDGMGGTGIIGAIAKNGGINIAGITIPSAETAEIFLNGNVSNSAALVSGRIAAVLIDNERAVREIHVFDQFVGPVPFMQSVSRLIVRGQILDSAIPDKVTVNGLTISGRALGGKKPGDIVRIDASAVPAGGFKIKSVEKVSAAIERPQSVESIIKPVKPSSVENKPADVVRPDIVTDRPVRPEPPEPPTRPERFEKPEIPAPPTRPAPVDRPVLPDRPVRPVVPVTPDRPVLDRPEPPVVVEPPILIDPPDITPVVPSLDRPVLPNRLD